MATRTSKSALLYDEMRLALQAGRYAPGEHIDPAAVATEFRTSPTPVRFALYRLVGEGVIADHGRRGFDVPLPTEAMLSNLYDWMQRLLLMACDIRQARSQPGPSASDPADLDGDVIAQTRHLFEAIATGHHFLHLAVRQANDRLDPIRRAKQFLVPDAQQELARLLSLWRQRHLRRLRTALIVYHERRKRLVPQIIALLASRATT